MNISLYQKQIRNAKWGVGFEGRVDLGSRSSNSCQRRSPLNERKCSMQDRTTAMFLETRGGVRLPLLVKRSKGKKINSCPCIAWGLKCGKTKTDSWLGTEPSHPLAMCLDLWSHTTTEWEPWNAIIRPGFQLGLGSQLRTETEQKFDVKTKLKNSPTHWGCKPKYMKNSYGKKISQQNQHLDYEFILCYFCEHLIKN